jgi:hypothetical protein
MTDQPIQRPIEPIDSTRMSHIRPKTNS